MSENKKQIRKIVVFDLDETLGSFVQMGIFWDTFVSFMKLQKNTKPNQYLFNDLLDLYPEFLRPFILNILDYIKTQKKNGTCDKVFIFTNNHGPVSWAEMVKNYLEKKINYNLFDKIIGAYEVNGVVREKCRTSHDKSYIDLLRCANIDSVVKVCFVDDLLHQGMIHPYVDYIKIHPYNFQLPPLLMIERALHHSSTKKYINFPLFFKNYMMVNMSNYSFQIKRKTKEEYNVDIIASNKTFHYIQTFLQG